MNIHLVIAHPNRDSLNFAMKQAAVDVLQADHQLEQTDVYQLYAQNNPLTRPYGLPLSAADLELIAVEQEKIRDSDLVIMQFPMYWFSVPALMKNYWEMVLRPGFAYPGSFANSPLCGKKILLSTTTQSVAENYSANGANGPIKSILFHLATAFRFVGFDIIEPFIAYNVPDMTQQEITSSITQFKTCVNAAVNNPRIWQHV